VMVRSNFDPLQPVVGFIGGERQIPISKEFLKQQLSSPEVRAIAAKSPFFRSPENALLLFAGDLRSAEPGFGAFPMNTDDKPILAFLGPREPRPGERLIGMSFLNWIGKRFLKPVYPSCELGDTNAAVVLASIRAANYYYAAAVANSSMPGDKRPESVRVQHVTGYLQQAHALDPGADIPFDALGQ
jgi:hypothetical protein